VRPALPDQVRLELAREHRAVLLELAPDVAPEARVRLPQLHGPALPRVRALPPAPHPSAHERQRLERPDERVPFEQLALLPEQALELGAVVLGPKSAEQDEVLRRGDRGDRVQLEEAEAADGVEDIGRAPVEELRTDGDPT